MTALSAARVTRSKRIDGRRNYPLAAVKAYAGSLIMLNSAGFATPAAAVASNKNCVGVAESTVDNSGGSAGDKSIVVLEGIFNFAATTIAQSNLGSFAFASDDQTVDETQGTNYPRAGIIEEYVSASEAWIEVSAKIAAL